MFGSRRSRQDRKERAERSPGRRPARRRRGLIAGTFYWGTVFSIWAGIAVFAAGLYVAISLPEPASFELPERNPGITILDVNGAPMARRGSFRGDAVRLDELPPYLARAVIATEDRRFYDHWGIDPYGLARAVLANIRARRIVQGGSTITQQLAKNLFLKPERTLKRKVQEAVLAVWLESLYSKDEILQIYLNRVYLGSGSFGVDAAAKRYFNKSAREVSLAQAALLAGLLKAPSRYAPNRYPKRAEKRAKLVLNAMVEAGFISREQGQAAINNPAAATRLLSSASGQYVIDWVSELVGGLIGEARNREIIVETTIDPRLQAAAEKAVLFNMAAYGDEKNAGEAALVALGPGGSVRALIGGRSYSGSQFNRAIQARRQPGSAFKPFVYLAALEQGLSPDDIRPDAPLTIGKWRPRNYSNTFLGPVTLRQALSLSINTVAARLTGEVGPGRVVAEARKLGITSPLHKNPSIALGTAEVSLLELSAAYVPFSNGGRRADPYVIRSIRTPQGEWLYRRQPVSGAQVVSARALRSMNDMLSAALNAGTGKRARLSGQSAAGKTGTSQGFRDAWFIGYTAYLTAGVWTGNDDGKPMARVTGGGLPALIWRDFMASAHSGLERRPLPGLDRSLTGGIASLLRAIGLGGGGRSGPEAAAPDALSDDALNQR